MMTAECGFWLNLRLVSQSTTGGHFDLLDDASWVDKHYFMNLDTLDGMVVFVTVAECKNFRIAGERLRVSASAVSQSLRKLENRLGVSLVHRTTRSVRLSEAGERLFSSAR